MEYRYVQYAQNQGEMVVPLNLDMVMKCPIMGTPDSINSLILTDHPDWILKEIRWNSRRASPTLVYETRGQVNGDALHKMQEKVIETKHAQLQPRLKMRVRRTKDRRYFRTQFKDGPNFHVSVSHNELSERLGPWIDDRIHLDLNGHPIVFEKTANKDVVGMYGDEFIFWAWFGMEFYTLDYYEGGDYPSTLEKGFPREISPEPSD